MRAGVVPVPVNHKFPPATVAAVLADCGARLVLCDGPRRAALPPLAPGVGLAAFDGEGPEGFSAWLDPGPFVPITPEPDEAALFLYTSGSTGRPKGVRLSHASHLWVARTRAAETDLRGERLLVAAPLYHMNALALALLVCAAGATMVLLPQFEARSYIAAIDRHRCTWLTAVPPMIAMMLREKDLLASSDLTGVRTVRMGSAPVSDTLAHQIRALLPNARILNAYGTTEGGPIVFGDHPNGLPTPVASVGAPRPDVAIRLVGPDAPGAGVLQMRSPRDHARLPQPAGRARSDHPGRLLRHGGRVPPGRRGLPLFPGPHRRHVRLRRREHLPRRGRTRPRTPRGRAAILRRPVEDAIKGTKPVAFVVRRPGATLDEAGIKAHALAHAPAYQHPRRVWFVEALPSPRPTRSTAPPCACAPRRP